MARWVFRQTDEPARHDRASGWIWELERDDGQIIKRSAGKFSNLQLCKNDAAKYGYYGGHYAVRIRGRGTHSATTT